jgi:hypothetical protein
MKQIINYQLHVKFISNNTFKEFLKMILIFKRIVLNGKNISGRKSYTESLLFSIHSLFSKKF